MIKSFFLSFLFLQTLFSFSQNIQPIQLKMGQLLAGVSDTLYARVLPNEVLYIDCRVKGVKSGINFKVLTMGNHVIYVKEGLKRERLRLPLKQEQEVVKIVLTNTSSSIGKLFLEVYRICSEDNPQQIDQTIYWQDVVDTTYKWVERPYYEYGDMDLVKILDETRKVHSVSSPYENEDCVSFTLPDKTVKWSYYIGVNQEGNNAYQSAISNVAAMAGKLVDSPFQLTPLAGLMAYGLETIAVMQQGEDIDFEVLDERGSEAFKADEPTKPIVAGRMINGARAFESPSSGNWNICLENDNIAMGVAVRVVVEALVRPYTVKMQKVKEIDQVITRKSWFVK